LQALPQFVLTIVIGLIDGLVRRDLRRFGAGHESGFVYHHARRMIGSSLAAKGLVWRGVAGVAGVAGGASFLESRYIVIHGVMLSGLAGSVATGAFKSICNAT
jgi:hypothetical protein